jgi:nitroreductase
MQQQIEPDKILESLSWRYATKKFDSSKRIPSKLWTALESSLVLTPSSYGLQPWGFVVVDSPALRRELRAAAYGQAQVEDASHLVVMCSRDPFRIEDVDAHIARISELRSTDPSAHAGFRTMAETKLLGGNVDVARWADEQVHIALGQLMLSAALLGIDTCALGGIDPAGFDAVLGLRAKGLRTVVACAVGYRLDTDKYATLPKVRFASERVILRA